MSLIDCFQFVRPPYLNSLKALSHDFFQFVIKNLMTLIDRLRAKRIQLQERQICWGMEAYQKNLIAVKATYGEGFEIDYQYSRLEPNPKIVPVPDNQVGLPYSDGTILLSKDDLIVSRLDRSLTEAELTDNIEHFLVGVFLSNDFRDGDRYSLAHLDGSKSFGWKLILRKIQDR